MLQAHDVGDEAGTEQERINPSSVRPLAVIARQMPRTCTRQCETANIVLVNRSIVSAAAITDWPQMDQLTSDIADDMNAEKLPIVPTKDQLHKAISAGSRPALRRPPAYRSANGRIDTSAGRVLAQLTSAAHGSVLDSVRHGLRSLSNEPCEFRQSEGALIQIRRALADEASPEVTTDADEVRIQDQRPSARSARCTAAWAS
jgi:hypothetical protein